MFKNLAKTQNRPLSIYELKPNNPRAIARGNKQLDRYTAAATQKYGGKWTGVLVLYD